MRAALQGKLPLRRLRLACNSCTMYHVTSTAAELPNGCRAQARVTSARPRSTLRFCAIATQTKAGSEPVQAPSWFFVFVLGSRVCSCKLLQAATARHWLAQVAAAESMHRSSVSVSHYEQHALALARTARVGRAQTAAKAGPARAWTARSAQRQPPDRPSQVGSVAGLILGRGLGP